MLQLRLKVNFLITDPMSYLSELAGLLVTGLKRETRSKQRYSR